MILKTNSKVHELISGNRIHVGLQMCVWIAVKRDRAKLRFSHGVVSRLFLHRKTMVFPWPISKPADAFPSRPSGHLSSPGEVPPETTSTLHGYDASLAHCQACERLPFPSFRSSLRLRRSTTRAASTLHSYDVSLTPLPSLQMAFFPVFLAISPASEKYPQDCFYSAWL